MCPQYCRKCFVVALGRFYRPVRWISKMSLELVAVIILHVAHNLGTRDALVRTGKPSTGAVPMH